MEQLLLVVSVIIVLAVCQGQCPVGWTRFQYYCVFLNKHTATWEEADGHCRAFSSHLTSLDTEAKDKNMEAFLAMKGYFDPVWTDGTDQLILDLWMWAASGQALTYTNWFPMEPDLNGSQDCLAFINNGTTWWWSRDCNALYAFVCEKDATFSHNTSHGIVVG